jgi:very-short-patch-repair endonuclease
MAASFDATAAVDLVGVANRLLEHFPPWASDRYNIEELLWREDRGPTIPKRFRRELARSLSHNDLFLHEQQFRQLLGRLWVLDDDQRLVFENPNSLRKQIDRHIFDNEDWSPEELFDHIGAYNCSNRRFALFVEGMASADVRPDVAEQRRFVQIVNDSLRLCGVELRETQEDGGYPVFSMVPLAQSHQGRPKNLIFASPIKPDLRFRDAVNNDIEIVTNANRVLVYDRPIGPEGLRWRDLQEWWADARGMLDHNEAKKSLYRRLRDSLPKKSPPQKLFFRAFFSSFQATFPDLPALLPEVWLHWDPKTVEERGADALTRFRMDFLLLLPAGVRIVVEIDGKHHYADDGGRACPSKYATMVAADRELRLAGYELYRFGADELRDDDDGAPGRVTRFFEALFEKHGVSPAGR